MKSIRDTCIGLLKNQEILSLINECKSHVVKLVYDEIYIYIWLICIYSILLLIIVLAILILLFGVVHRKTPPGFKTRMTSFIKPALSSICSIN